ncbi:MAG TPA: alpha/beta fold hydrolase [Verrucomicrobiae bacterium]|nr:alpha/beta fold hydrolase [Verrucomicrobiae bacterium]
MKRTLKVLAGLAALLLVLAGGYLGANRVPDRPVAELAARWAPPPSRFEPIAGMNVHLRDEGPREDPLPIVLLHGTGASLHTWDGWVDALKGERRVVRFDLPGFGLTGPEPGANYSIENYARVTAAVLDHLGIQRCVLAGNSLGGYVAWATAVLHADRVDRLVLVDAGGYPYQSTSVPLGFRIARMPVLRTLMRDVLPRGVIRRSLQNVYGDPSKVTPELIDRYFDMTTREGNRLALRQRFAQTMPGVLAERVPELKMPTLILWGGRDGLIPLSQGERFHREIAGSELRVFDALGHVPQEEDPATTVAALKDFLARP